MKCRLHLPKHTMRHTLSFLQGSLPSIMVHFHGNLLCNKDSREQHCFPHPFCILMDIQLLCHKISFSMTLQCRSFQVNNLESIHSKQNCGNLNCILDTKWVPISRIHGLNVLCYIWLHPREDTLHLFRMHLALSSQCQYQFSHLGNFTNRLGLHREIHHCNLGSITIRFSPDCLGMMILVFQLLFRMLVSSMRTKLHWLNQQKQM